MNKGTGRVLSAVLSPAALAIAAWGVLAAFPGSRRPAVPDRPSPALSAALAPVPEYRVQEPAVAEIADAAKWETFLREAEIVGQEQMTGRLAVTQPWKLSLKLGAVRRHGLWKNPEGRMGGFVEGWRYEIAAYLLDRHLGLNMVPPTVERRFRENRGSLQLWIEDCMTLQEKEGRKLRTPSIKIPGWNRATYLQRAFDNLIANGDRHLNQILITPDWRLVLIDHSRAFGASRFDRRLIYTEKHREGPKLMRQLPRGFFEKLRALDLETVRRVTGDYLTNAEIENLLARRDLIAAEIERLIGIYGTDGAEGVLYGSAPTSL